MLLRRILMGKRKMNLNLIKVNFRKSQLKKQAPQLLIETKKMKIWYDLLKKLVYSSNNKTKSRDINKFREAPVEELV